jgi:uncharacterized cupin superfamily protein
MSNSDPSPEPQHTKRPAAILAADAPPRARPSSYPELLAKRLAGREKRPLGDLFGLGNFGVNLTRLPPGAASALHHLHSRQDELVYVLEGEPTPFLGDDEVPLRPGMVAGFPAGGPAHHLENRTDRDAVILEIGDRSPGDEGSYPHDDLRAVLDEGGRWRFLHKDGTPYQARAEGEP